MKKILIFLFVCCFPLGVFADVKISLTTTAQDVTLGAPFIAEVLLEYGEDDILGEIYMDGLDDFTLIGETRSDSQGFTQSGSVYITAITLELIGKQVGLSQLGPALLTTDTQQIKTQINNINIIPATGNQKLKQYTPISSIYFKNRAFDIQTLKNVTVLFTIFSVLLVAIMYGIYKQNLAARKLKYMQVLNHLETKIKSKNATKFYTEVYELFISYMKHEKKKGFTSSSIAELKKHLNHKEYDILDLVYNVKHNVSKDSPKYRKNILKKFHKYFDKNIV